MGLREYLRACQGRPFRYGRWDCALFAAGWVQAQTGRDLTLGIRYASLREGREKLAAAGFADHVAVAAAELPGITVAQAQTGDVAAHGQSLGVVTGERVRFLSRRGPVDMPLMSADRAFAVRKPK